MPEIRCQRSEVRYQMSEVRSQKKIRNPKLEILNKFELPKF